MARKTIKGLEVIITDLEKRLNEQNKINVELHNKISQMQPDDKFENSPIYHQMVKEIEKLKPCWSKTLREKIYVHNLIYLLKHTNVILVF